MVSTSRTITENQMHMYIPVSEDEHRSRAITIT